MKVKRVFDVHVVNNFVIINDANNGVQVQSITLKPGQKAEDALEEAGYKPNKD